MDFKKLVATARLRGLPLAALFLLVIGWSRDAAAYSHPGSLYTQGLYADSYVAGALSNAEPWATAYRDMISKSDSCLNHESQLAVEHTTFLNGKRVFMVPGFYSQDKGAAHIAKSKPLADDAYYALLCAMRWMYTGDASYQQKAIDLLAPWTQTTVSSAEDTYLVMTYAGVGLLLAADILRWGGDGTWFAPFKTWATAQFHVAASTKYTDSVNNHRSWGLYGELVYAHLVDNETLFRSRTDQLYAHINASIDGDGFMPREVERENNGLWYTAFSLAPISSAVQAVNNVLGSSVAPPAGTNERLRHAIQNFIYYNAHPAEWTGYQPMSSTHVTSLYEGLAGMLTSQELSVKAVPERPILGGQRSDGSGTQFFAWNFPTLMRPLHAATLPPIVHKQTFDNGVNEFVPLNGTWGVSTEEGGAYRQNSASSNAKAIVGNLNWLDYTIEARLKMKSFRDSPAGAGVVFRYQDVNNHYTFHYYASTRQMRIERRIDNVTKVLAAVTMSGGLQLGQWYRFRVQVNGPKILAYLDDTLYFSVTDHKLLGGAAGLWAHRADVLFDDAVVTNPVGLDLEFSNHGRVDGKSCLSLNEPNDAAGTWSDNYVCANQDLGWTFYTEGDPGLPRCTKIDEGAEPEGNGWTNNYLCLPVESSFEFHWSMAADTRGLSCEWFDEPSDTYTWGDNILCY
jgi:hypothetical protein